MRTFYHLAPEVNDIRLTGDAVDSPAFADDRRNMFFPVVFDIKQIKMRLDNRDGLRISNQPFLGGKNRRRNIDS